MPTRISGMDYCGCRFRRFYLPEEEADRLERYKERLQKEIAGVERRIKELKQKQ
jgi:hypothetical protein